MSRVFARELGELYSLERQRSRDLQHALTSLEETYLATMTSLAQVVEAKDETTRGHLDRTTKYGMALAERMLAARFNRPGLDIVDHRTFAFCGEGDMMEGISSEAASLAGRLHLGLGKPTVFFDSNHITLEGAADVEFAENVAERFEAYGWHVTEVSDVNALGEIDAAIAAAETETGRPSLVLVHSHIGYGSPVQDTATAHGEPLGEENVAKTRAKLGWPYPPFEIPDAVYDHWRGEVAKRAAARSAWLERFERYRADHPEQAPENSKSGS